MAAPNLHPLRGERPEGGAGRGADPLEPSASRAAAIPKAARRGRATPAGAALLGDPIVAPAGDFRGAGPEGRLDLGREAREHLASTRSVLTRIGCGRSRALGAVEVKPSPTQAAWRRSKRLTTPIPLALRNHFVYTRRHPIPPSIPRTPHAHPPPPPARPPHAPAQAAPALFPIFRRGRFETGLFRSRRLPPHPLATSAHPASLAPSQPSPHGPNLPRQPAKKSGPSYLSPARPLWGRAGER